MAKKMDAKMSKAMDMASSALGEAPKKSARVKKTIHMTIEPTDNKGFAVKHEEHHDGVPTGKRKHHVFAKASDMHKHVMKTYPAPAAEAAPEQEPAPAAEPAPAPAPAAAMPEQA